MPTAEGQYEHHDSALCSTLFMLWIMPTKSTPRGGEGRPEQSCSTEHRDAAACWLRPLATVLNMP
jgi:hypothetical protein